MSKIVNYQNLVLYKINPNEQELEGDVSFDKNVDGRIFSHCQFEIKDHAIFVYDDKKMLKGIFSLHHFYLLNKD
jgi:hypothetical protein